MILILGTLLMTLFAYADSYSNQASHSTLYTDTITSKTDGSPVRVADSDGFQVTTGNVGIGTTSPNEKLHVDGNMELGSGNDINIKSLGKMTVDIDYSNGPDTGDGFELKIAGNPAFVIPGTNPYTGNVGIGTTTPAQKLSVAGVIESTSGGFKFPDGTLQTTSAGGGGTQWNNGTGGIYYNSGNVGIGKTAPATKFHIAGPVGSNELRIENTDLNRYSYFGHDWSGPYWRLSTNADVFQLRDQSGIQWLTIINGRLGVGSVSPEQKLDVYGGSDTDTYIQTRYLDGIGNIRAFVGVQDSLTGNRLAAFGADSSSTDISFQTGGKGVANEKVRITSSGNVGIGSTNPQRPLDIRRDSAGTLTLIGLYNADTSNNNGAVISFRGDTTGTGATAYQELGAMHVKVTDHNNPTASSEYGFWNMINGMLTETMILSSVGNVGIGTTSPASILQTKEGIITVGTSGDKTQIYGGNGFGSLLRMYYADGTENIRLDAGGSGGNNWINSGNLGIGTTNPGSKATVANGDVYVSTQGNGIILKDNIDGSCRKIILAGGSLSVSGTIACPAT